MNNKPTIQQQKVSDNIAKLNRNFLFQMSLASKELFHSNFLAWLLELDNRIAELFLKAIGISIDKGLKDIEPQREKHNLDLHLMVTWKDESRESIVIENKMKSTPSKNQLEKYEATFNKHLKTFANNERPKTFILSMESYNFEGENKWISITYNDHILKFLNCILASSKEGEIQPYTTNKLDNRFDFNIIIQAYIELIEGLYGVIADFFAKDSIEDKMHERIGKSRYSYYANLNDLRNIRIHDMVLKILHANICIILKDKWEKKNPESKLTLSYHSDFTNSTGLSSIELIIEEKFAIGIQLQENHLKYFVECKMESGINQNTEWAQNLYKEQIWFYDFETDEKKPLKGNGRKENPKVDPASANSKHFCSYSKSTFLYLYKDLNESKDNPMSVDELTDIIIRDLSNVIDNENKIKSLIPKK